MVQQYSPLRVPWQPKNQENDTHEMLEDANVKNLSDHLLTQITEDVNSHNKNWIFPCYLNTNCYYKYNDWFQNK